MPRPRKLIATKKLQGTYRNNQEPVKEPMVVPDAPKMPRPPERYAKDMSEAALAYWALVEPDLQAAGLFKVMDVATLVKWCRLSADIDELQKDLAENGYSYKTDNGYRNERPEVRSLSRLWDMYKAVCREFGLTPLSRDGIRKPEQDTMNDLERLMNQSK